MARPMCMTLVLGQQVGGGGVEQLAQVGAVDVFHDEVEEVVFAVGVVDLDDVVLAPLGDGAGFLHQALGVFWFVPVPRINHLHGDGSLQDHVCAVID